MAIKIKVAGGNILIQDASREQFGELTGSGKYKWDRYKYQDRRTGEIKTEKALMAPANLSNLDLLRDVLRKSRLSLPPDAAKLRQELHATKDAVDKERMNEKPTAFVKPPVKLPMYSHQVKAFNMCLLTFGWVQSGGESDG